MSLKVLIIDDEAAIRDETEELLLDEGYECLQAAGVDEALERLRADEEIAIALVDLKMPGKGGLDMLAAARNEFGDDRDLEFIMVTGHGGTREAIESLRLGALDFLLKPVDSRHLLHRIERTAELINLRRSRRYYERGLEEELSAKTVEIRGLLRTLETAYEEALDSLAEAAEYKDPETGQHIRRIGAYSELIATRLEWSKERRRIIRLAAPLHDVGKIGTPDAVLLKPGKLDAKEIAMMKQHPEIGYGILSRSRHPVMQCAANIAWAHHERWDGGGYPRKLKGEEIPIEARIATLGDIYDALRSERPYKPPFNHQTTVSIMLDGDGRTEPEHFDPRLLQIFRDHADAFAGIFAQLAD